MLSRQPSVKGTFGHNIWKAYHALSEEQQLLDPEELSTLRIASQKYRATDLTYFNPEDALTAFKSFPNLEVLDRITMRLWKSSPL